MNYFKYGEREIEHLKKRDTIHGDAIDKIGMIKRKTEPDIFYSLVSSIISQQISTKAAATIKIRLMNLVGEINPENINATSANEIQKCGMSLRKAGYIKGIAEAAITKTINFGNLHRLSDKEVIEELTKLKGVGEWTAEMLLIHSLERPDILSYKDLGIRKGIIKLYELEELSIEEFEIYRRRYSPYSTVASIYLWEINKN
jgi:DNA-3-methyladenine glycosylase II